jgi:RNA polymerase sigma-70 factor (ECF subfamily)
MTIMTSTCLIDDTRIAPSVNHGAGGEQQMETARCIYECSLVREAQGGNHAAFAQLVHAHDETVLRVALRITGSQSDAQDIYQEVFLKVYKKLDCFRFDSSFSTWISRITTNTCLDYLRKARNRRENDTLKAGFDGTERDLLDQVADDRPANDPERELLRRELRTNILSALRRLTPQERMVFDMKHFQGMKLRAVGEILNVSEGCVKTSLVRATRKLRVHLGSYTQQNSSMNRSRPHLSVILCEIANR